MSHQCITKPNVHVFGGPLNVTSQFAAAVIAQFEPPQLH